MHLSLLFRAKRFRDKRRVLGIKPKRRKLTRSQKIELKEYNRIKQQESRKRRSEKKKEEKKEYDRKRISRIRRKKKMRVINKDTHTYQNGDGLTCKFISPEAVRQSSLRLRVHFPKSPRKYTAVLSHIINQAKRSPKKRQFLEQHLNFSPTFPKRAKLEGTNREGMKVLKDLKSLKDEPQRKEFIENLVNKYQSQREASRKLGIRWNLFQRLCSRKRMVQIKLRNIRNEKVTNFFYKPNISITLPDRKYAGKHYMTRSVKEVHAMYEQDNDPVPFSSFAKGRPKNVKPMHHTPQRQCICEVCANFSLVLKALYKCGLKAIKSDNERAAIRASLCEPTKTEFHNLDCLCRRCNICGVDKVELAIKSDPAYEAKKVLNWHRWVKTKKKMFLASVTGKMDQLLEVFIDDLRDMGLHTFHADWQYKQFAELKKDVPKGMVVQVLDFAKNYLCLYQDEAQACYWKHEQVTLHPIVTYYKDPVCGHQVTEELMFITPDLQHDAHAVLQFSREAELHLLGKMGQIDSVVQFTDQCASQYKSKTPFQHLSAANIPTSRIYFGSRHGKSPADGFTGRIKKAVVTAVKSRQAVIDDAESFYKFCQENLATKDKTNECQHHRVHFFYIEKINRTTCRAETLPGTRQIHAVKSCGKAGLLRVRFLACTSDCCMDGGDSCQYQDWVDDWVEVNLASPSSRLLRLGNKVEKKKSPTVVQKKSVKTGRKKKSQKSANAGKSGGAAQKKKTTNTSTLSQSDAKVVPICPRISTRSVTSRKRKVPPAEITNQSQKSTKARKSGGAAQKKLSFPEESTTIIKTRKTTNTSTQSQSDAKMVPICPRISTRSITSRKRKVPPAEITNQSQKSAKARKSGGAAQKKLSFPEESTIIIKTRKTTNTSTQSQRDAKMVPICPRISTRSIISKKRKVPLAEITNQAEKRRKRVTATTWSSLACKMSQCKNYSELEELVLNSKVPPLPTCTNNHSILSTKSSIDQNSLKIIDQKDRLWPVQIYGEGNCLPLTISVLHYGTKNHAQEMRARIVAEGVIHKTTYLDHKYLKVGASKLYKKTNLPKIFAQYSEHYTPGDILTPSVVERVYEEEMLQYTQNYTYSGIWQIAMSAAVLQRRVISHYPSTIVNPAIVCDLDRYFLPHDRIEDTCLQTAHIQWTYSGRITGIPNHFVPLLPMATNEQEPVLDE
jgi:hypothetical protein